LGFCRNTLTLSGLAYISYNAQPGWATRRLVRETLLRSRLVNEASLECKAAKAIQVATQLLKDLPYPDCAASVVLSEELQRVCNGKPFYVLHEYLAEANDGFWLRDFVERARQHDLDYVCDAQFCRWEGHVPSDLRACLAKRGLDIIEQEETADLLCDRYFRASILYRQGPERTRMSHRELLEQVHIASSLAAHSDPVELRRAKRQTFLGTGGPEVILEEPITKAAIILMAARWPRGTTLGRIYLEAVELLATHGISVPETAHEQLSDDLITLFEAGQIDLRLSEPPFNSSVPERPQAHALARFEAEHRDALTSPYHLPILFDIAALGLIRNLDGTRTRSQLHDAFGDDLVDQTLSICARWGFLDPRAGG
jgi:methyltransferase-like protein